MPAHSSSSSAMGLVAVFSATVSAEELRAILLSSAGGADQHPARHSLGEVAQHLHLTRDSLHTLPEMGFAEVVTGDVALADALEFTDAEVIDVASRTKRVLVRAPGGGDWQRVGMVCCGPSEPLLPPLLADSDIHVSCMCSTTLPADAPLVWQWVHAVVTAAAVPAPAAAVQAAGQQHGTAPFAPPSTTAPQQHQQKGSKQQKQHGAAAGAWGDAPFHQGDTSDAEADAVPAPWMEDLTTSPSPTSSATAATTANALRHRSFACSFPLGGRGSSSSFCSSASSLSSSSRLVSAGWQAVVRAASFTASADGAHLRLTPERCQASLARLAMSPVRPQRVVPGDAGQGVGVGGRGRGLASGIVPFLAQAAARLASVHSRSVPLISH